MAKPGPVKGTLLKSVEQHKLDDTYRRDRHGPPPTPLELTKPEITRLPTKRATMPWVRSEADERAVANGCRFCEDLAWYVVDWVAKYLQHGEGQWAGKPFLLMDWQLEELFLPLFGWVKKSEEFGAIVRRYRKVYCEVPKKNGKSPTGAAIGTYMMAGDGEAGAKVFSIATDVKQAGIVHGYAIQMVEDSPRLSEHCKINRTTHRIQYRLNRSTYDVVSSVPRGSEGLNGNCAIIDELHAWYGDELYNSLKYMGRARLAPIVFQITTAGDDMQSICRKQHELAKAVLAGDEVQESFLPLIYGADRNDDWRDEGVWRQANPSLRCPGWKPHNVTPRGSTRAYQVGPPIVSLSAMRDDACDAAKSMTGVSTFKRYLLDIWMTAAHPWLNMDHWAACQEDYTEQDLLGQACWAGLDLAQSKDFTALALMFPDPDSEIIRQLVYLWLPEETIEARAHLADYREWVDAGWIEATPGNVCDYGLVKQRIIEIAEKFDLRELVYDAMYARDFTQQLEEERGIERVEFPQTITQYAGPTGAYERMITNGTLLHNGNDVLTWQAGHVMVKEDIQGNIRPVKQKRNDYRTIDGIVAGVMALSRAIVAEDTKSCYESDGDDAI